MLKIVSRILLPIFTIISLNSCDNPQPYLNTSYVLDQINNNSVVDFNDRIGSGYDYKIVYFRGKIYYSKTPFPHSLSKDTELFYSQISIHEFTGMLSEILEGVVHDKRTSYLPNTPAYHDRKGPPEYFLKIGNKTYQLLGGTSAHTKLMKYVQKIRWVMISEDDLPGLVKKSFLWY